jgi:hypothetical protein
MPSALKRLRTNGSEKADAKAYLSTVALQRTAYLNEAQQVHYYLHAVPSVPSAHGGKRLA